MAVVGHWDTLAEAQKLVQSMLLQGVVQTVIESGHLIPRLPVKQITGKDLLYNREDSWNPEDGGGFYAIREQITWSSDVTYTPITVPLKIMHRQDPIDNFVKGTYNDPNDYAALMLQQLAKRLTRFVEHGLIYGDVTFGGVKQFDGLHALAEENSGDLDIDEGEGALSLQNLRKLLDAIKIDDETAGRGNVIILAPKQLVRRMSAGYQEAGLIRTNVTHAMSQISMSTNDIGARVMAFDGIPIVPSGFLVAEDANTGVGSNVRGVNRSGSSEMFSIFAIRFGSTEDGGLELLFGGEGHDIGQVFKRTPFEKLEDYDSGGERLTAYLALALGAGHSLGRIYDITDAEVTP